MFPWLRGIFGRRPEAVRRIAAFKEDLETHDRIVLLIEETLSGEPLLAPPEDCPGFEGLFGPMEQTPGVD